MKFPVDLPWIVEYRCGKTVRATLCRHPVAFIGSNGATDSPQVCPQIPLGCDGWRLVGESDWKPLEDIPAHWKPFLERERGTEMDPRRKPKCENTTKQCAESTTKIPALDAR